MKKHLIVGLGNPGEKYENTRHNIGFKVIDEVAKKLKGEWEPSNFGMLFKSSYKGRPVYLLKPDTYMNLSGKAVKYYSKKLGIKPENILIITDDLHLPFGTLRMKAKGSNAGHNGLASIENELHTQKYPRLRFGVGNDFDTGKQVEYVLSDWNNEEQQLLPERLSTFSDAVLNYIFHGLNNTMNAYNGK